MSAKNVWTLLIVLLVPVLAPWRSEGQQRSIYRFAPSSPATPDIATHRGEFKLFRSSKEITILRNGELHSSTYKLDDRTLYYIDGNPAKREDLKAGVLVSIQFDRTRHAAAIVSVGNDAPDAKELARESVARAGQQRVAKPERAPPLNRLATEPEVTFPFFALNTGVTGHLKLPSFLVGYPSWSAKVIQITSDKEMLVDVAYKEGANRSNLSIWVQGVPTSGLADGDEWKTDGDFREAGTKTYKTAFGSTTRHVIEPVKKP